MTEEQVKWAEAKIGTEIKNQIPGHTFKVLRFLHGINGNGAWFYGEGDGDVKYIPFPKRLKST